MSMFSNNALLRSGVRVNIGMEEVHILFNAQQNSHEYTTLGVQISEGSD